VSLFAWTSGMYCPGLVRHSRPILALALAEVAVFAQLLFTGAGGIPFRVIPWDFRSAQAPWIIYGWDSIRAGFWPLWCPYAASGLPFFANPQTQIYSPLALIFGGLFGYSYRLAQVHLVLMMLVGGVGAYALATSVWRERAPALLAGLCYQFSGVLYSHLEHGPILAAFSLAPWLFLAVILTVERRSPWGLPLLAGVVYWLFTGGYPGVILMLALWGTAFAVALAWKQPLAAGRGRLLGGCAAAAGLGFAMAAITWLPFVVNASEFTRGSALPLETVLSASHSLAPKHLWSLVLPFIPTHPFPGTDVDVTFRGLYFGAVAVALAVVGLIWTRGWMVGVLAAAAIGGLLMSLGGDFFPRVALHTAVPIFNFSQYPAADSSFLAVLSLSLLAGGGAALVARRYPPAVALARRTFVVLLVGYVLAVAGMQLVYHDFVDAVTSGVTFEALCMLLALAALERGRGGTRLYALLAGIVLLETGYSVMVNFEVAGQTIAPEDYVHLRDDHVRELSAAAPVGPRLGDPRDLQAQTSSAAYLEKKFYVGDYNPVRLKSYETLIAAGFVSWLKDGPRLAALPRDANPATFAQFNARVSQVPFSIVEYTPNRVRYSVQTPNEVLLVFNEIYFPGWTATVDGAPAPVRPVAGGLRGVVVRGGAHDVVTTFRPTEYFVALVISLASVVAFIVWVIVLGRRGRAPAPGAGDPTSPLFVDARQVEA
jgi:hypothetical protein